MNLNFNIVNRIFGRNGHAMRAAASDEVRVPDANYIAAGYSRKSLQNWNPATTSPLTELTEYERKTLTARAYDAVRNQEIIRSIIGRNRDHVVGTGLKLAPVVDGEYLGLSEDETDYLENLIESEFEMFAESTDIDIMRQLNFYEYQLLILTTWHIAGDCFINSLYLPEYGKIYDLTLQAIDPERICNPNHAPDTKTIKKGVEVNEDGAPVAIHALNAHPADVIIAGSDIYKWQRIPIYGDGTNRRRLFHIFDGTWRPETIRGISQIALALEPGKQLVRLKDAELMASVLQSYLTFFIEEELEKSIAPGKPSDKEKKKQLDNLRVGNGTALQLPPGFHAIMANPTRPNGQYDPFFASIARLISAGADMPVDEVLLKYDASFSAARACFLKAWSHYKMQRIPVINKFCKHVYSLFFDEAVAKGVFPVKDYADPRRRRAYQGHTWIGVGRGSIDEPSEIQAAQGKVNMGISDLYSEAAEIRGESLKDILRRQARALREFKKRGIQLNLANQFGQPVAPQSLLDKQKEKEAMQEEESNA